MDSILKPLYYAVSWVMTVVHSALGYVLGKESHESLKWTLSIVSLVIIIRVLLIPLFVKQIKSQRAMTVLQPKMKEIQKRHKDDRQKQSEEMMKLYKEHKTNLSPAQRAARTGAGKTLLRLAPRRARAC